MGNESVTQPAAVMGRASQAAIDVVRGVRAEQLDGPTPCPEMDVRALVNHLMLWTGERGLTAGLKRPPVPDGASEGHDFTTEPDWANAYADRSAATAAAWSEAVAWEGETSMAGPTPMAARFVGGIVLGEWLMHGWDLAAATGQTLRVDDEVADVLYAETAAKADMARQYNVFGPEVEVAADAPLFDRALGLAGRDPSWRA